MSLHSETVTEVRPASRATLERRLRNLLAQHQARQREGRRPDAFLEADITTLQLELERSRV